MSEPNSPAKYMSYKSMVWVLVFFLSLTAYCHYQFSALESGQVQSLRVPAAIAVFSKIFGLETVHWVVVGCLFLVSVFALFGLWATYKYNQYNRHKAQGVEEQSKA